MTEAAGDGFCGAVQIAARIGIAENSRSHVCRLGRLVMLNHFRWLRILLRFHCGHCIADVSEDKHNSHQAQAASGD